MRPVRGSLRWRAISTVQAQALVEFPREQEARIRRDCGTAELEAKLGVERKANRTRFRVTHWLMPDGPLPRCYDAEFVDGNFHLLLEDLSETHAIITVWPLPPSDEVCERIIDTWAGFHAFWWRHPSLGHGA